LITEGKLTIRAAKFLRNNQTLKSNEYFFKAMVASNVEINSLKLEEISDKFLSLSQSIAFI